MLQHRQARKLNYQHFFQYSFQGNYLFPKSNNLYLCICFLDLSRTDLAITHLKEKNEIFSISFLFKQNTLYYRLQRLRLSILCFCLRKIIDNINNSTAEGHVRKIRRNLLTGSLKIIQDSEIMNITSVSLVGSKIIFMPQLSTLHEVNPRHETPPHVLSEKISTEILKTTINEI